MPGTSTTKDPFSINKLLLPLILLLIFYVGLLPPLLLGVLAVLTFNWIEKNTVTKCSGSCERAKN